MKIIDQAHSVTVLGVKGRVHLEGDERGLTCRYEASTKLGRRLSWDKDSAQPVLANYIRQDFGLPRAEGNMTHIRFVGI